MKRSLKILFLIVTIMSITAMPVYAASRDITEFGTINEESDLLPSTVQKSRKLVEKTPRGVFFSAAELQIINEDGEIGVLGTAYMSTEIDELYMTIYLDRWVDDDHWEQDGLTSELVAFTLTGYPTGHYYRLRGSYAAVKDGVMEGFGPVTDGVLIQ